MEYCQKLLVLEKTALLELTSEYPELPDSRTPNHESTFLPFCQDFSQILEYTKRFDRKFQGEILKIERRNLEDFYPKFAVKAWVILKPLIINELENRLKIGNFVKIFHKKLFEFYTNNIPSALPLAWQPLMYEEAVLSPFDQFCTKIQVVNKHKTNIKETKSHI